MVRITNYANCYKPHDPYTYIAMSYISLHIFKYFFFLDSKNTLLQYVDITNFSVESVFFHHEKLLFKMSTQLGCLNLQVICTNGITSEYCTTNAIFL